MNSQELITFLIDQAPRWVVLQRDLQRPNGRPLSPNEVHVLAPFFGPDVVHRARITDVPVISMRFQALKTNAAVTGTTIAAIAIR